MPGRAGFGAGLCRCRADRVGRVGVAVAFPVGGHEAARCSQSRRASGSLGTGPRAWRAHNGCVAAVCSPSRRIRSSIASASSCRYRSRSAEPVGGTCSVQGRNGCGLHAVEHVPNSGVQDTGDVAGAGHGPRRDGLPEDLGAVEPGGFGFAQRAPQPGAGWVVQGLVGEVGGQGATERVLELWRPGRGGSRRPRFRRARRGGRRGTVRAAGFRSRTVRCRRGRGPRRGRLPGRGRAAARRH